MVGDHFFKGNADYKSDEIPSDGEVKTKEALAIELPTGNASFNSLALSLAKTLPRDAALPTEKAAAEQWQKDRRAKLREVVKFKDYKVTAERVAGEQKDGLTVNFWRVKLGNDWTVRALELASGDGPPKSTSVVVNDGGRGASGELIRRLLTEGSRVVAVDPFYFGESKISSHDYLFALLVAAVGERPLGIQASQLAAVAGWAKTSHGQPVMLVAAGPRCSTVALAAAALEPDAVGGAELRGAMGSLKELLEQSRSVEEMPEMCCFGLLESFDVQQTAALVAPRPVRFVEPSDRAKSELAALKAWYMLLGRDFAPAQ